MTTRRHPTPFAVLKLPSKNKDLVIYGKQVAGALTDNVSFPGLDQAIAALLAHLAVLDGTLTTPGTLASQREAARCDVVHDLQHLRDDVQTAVEKNTSPADAAAMIESARMHVRRIGQRHKAALAVTRGHSPGVARLVAKAAGRHAVYYWQFRGLDEETWTSAPETRTADTTIEGLTPVKMYAFRFAALTKEGRGPFSQEVSFLMT